MNDLLHQVHNDFTRKLDPQSLLSLSNKLVLEFRDHLIESAQCMLPSFNYALPDGQELGIYLAIEVGGSNLRMALVELDPKNVDLDFSDLCEVVKFPIDSHVRMMEDYLFFDWMAARIRDMMAPRYSITATGRVFEPHEIEPLEIAVSWSFPIDQTSIQSGNVLGMGKNFKCSDTVKGKDLGSMIREACQRAGLKVHIAAIVNDGSASLLAEAYSDETTRLAVILGTGLNAAIYIPINSIDADKFGMRTNLEELRATHVVTNVELSMFGKNIFPISRWDWVLNANHAMPDYQPFEYLIAGGYLGEIVRLILVEAADTTTSFWTGGFPPTLREKYSLDTMSLAALEQSTLSEGHAIEDGWAEMMPSYQDAFRIRQIVRAVITRSIAYFSVGVYALTSLLQDEEDIAGREAGQESELEYFQSIRIGCDGSVINKYPGYMSRAQTILDQLREADPKPRRRVVLAATTDIAVFGAAVAGGLACKSSE